MGQPYKNDFKAVLLKKRIYQRNQKKDGLIFVALKNLVRVG
jgi:hypothetical protein